MQIYTRIYCTHTATATCASHTFSTQIFSSAVIHRTNWFIFWFDFRSFSRARAQWLTHCECACEIACFVWVCSMFMFSVAWSRLFFHTWLRLSIIVIWPDLVGISPIFFFNFAINWSHMLGLPCTVLHTNAFFVPHCERNSKRKSRIIRIFFFWHPLEATEWNKR